LGLGGGTLETGGVSKMVMTATWPLLVQREAWATDLDLPDFAVKAEQVSSTAARSAAYAVMR